MPWFKVDDNLAFHHKTVAAGNSAMGLWVRAGSWSAQQLTEGFIPKAIMLTMGTIPQAQALVRAGLWEDVKGGYRFWQWLEEGRQPTKEKVLGERAAARERQQKARERAASSRDSHAVTTPVTSPVSHGDVTPEVTVPPSRPVPTRPGNQDLGASSYVPDSSLEHDDGPRFPKPLHAGGLDLNKVDRALTDHTKRKVTPAQLHAIVDEILGRATSRVTAQTRFVLKAIENDWGEWQTFIDSGRGAV